MTRTVISSAGNGTPALLDKVRVTKPDISANASLDFDGPKTVAHGDAVDYAFTFRNGSRYGLNGAQAVVILPDGVAFDSASQGSATVHGAEVVVSLGRVAADSIVLLHVHAHVLPSAPKHFEASALLRSSTARPVSGESAKTKVDDETGKNQH